MNRKGKVFFQDKQGGVEYSTTNDKEFAIFNLPGENILLSLRNGYSFQLVLDRGESVDLVVTDYAKDVQETRVMMKAYLRKDN